MGSENSQAQFHLGQLGQLIRQSNMYEEDKKDALHLVEMVHNLLTFAAETQHNAALGVSEDG